MISYIFEDNPLKINKFTPNNIKIISANELNLKKPDYILILAWNFAESIIQKINHLLNRKVYYSFANT